MLVCALPFTSFDTDLRRRILEELPRVLAPRGVALVIQYSPLIQSELRRLFPLGPPAHLAAERAPAFLFACSAEAPAEGR